MFKHRIIKTKSGGFWRQIRALNRDHMKIRHIMTPATGLPAKHRLGATTKMRQNRHLRCTKAVLIQQFGQFMRAMPVFCQNQNPCPPV